MSNYNEFNNGVIERTVEEDLGALSEQIKRYHSAGVESVNKGLDYFRRTGEKLIQAKKQCKHGEFVSWFKKQKFDFNLAMATRYRKIARNWDKVKDAKTMAEALRWLVEEEEESKQVDTTSAVLPDLDSKDDLSEPEEKPSREPKKKSPQPASDGFAEVLLGLNQLVDWFKDQKASKQYDLAKRIKKILEKELKAVYK